MCYLGELSIDMWVIFKNYIKKQGVNLWAILNWLGWDPGLDSDEHRSEGLSSID
jgi:hypothetical protein